MGGRAVKTHPIEYFTLANGLRIVCEQVAGAAVDYFGVTINAGSRDEAPDRHGLAHFVEHTIFKGTTRRRACHIINRMEAVGGELNAFTSKEETTVYSVFPRGNAARAVELIADLITNSVFPEKELAKEREVVCEEIDSYLDTPSEAVFDDFENLFFRDSQLGHNILGDAASLTRFTPEVCRNYITSSYTPDRMVAFYRGALSPLRLRALCERHLSHLSSSPSTLHRIEPPVVAPFVERRETDTHQAHTVMGTRVPGLFSPDRHVYGLLTNILGGPGMNSRLNVELREKRGLVYTTDATLTLMSDCGLLAIYFGCDPADTSSCEELVREQLHLLATRPLTPRQLAAAKQQYLGQLTVASDNREQMALSAARATLYFGSVTSRAETTARISAITAPQLLQAAATLPTPSLLTLR